MKKHRLNKVVLACVANGALLFAANGLHADPQLDAVLEVGKSRHEAAMQSQKRVDKLADETRDLLTDYKTVMKQVDGLKVYNARLERQIADQEKRMARIENSIADVTVIQRQVMPLLLKMVDALEQFVALDVPFDSEGRQERIEFLRANIERSDLTTAEKFRQVLEAYKIENEYGRLLSTQEATINIDGVDRNVNLLQVGRIALVYQTSDKSVTGMWNNQSRQWEVLPDSEYKSAISQAIKIARKEAVYDIMKLPIAAPEAL